MYKTKLVYEIHLVWFWLDHVLINRVIGAGLAGLVAARPLFLPK